MLAYAVFASLWIGLSDVTVLRTVADAGLHERVDMLKGWAFVLVTSALLYVLVARLLRAQREALAQSAAAMRAGDNAQTLLRSLAEKSPDGIVVKDRGGRYLMFNRSAERITGLAAADALGATVEKLYPQEEAAVVRANDERVMVQDRSETFEESFDTLGGRTTVLITKNPLHDAAGTVIGMFGISRDITTEVAARKRLEDSERRYRSLFDAHPTPMFVFDAATLRFIAVNGAMVAHYGYTRDEFLAMTLMDIRSDHERQRLAAALADVARQPPSDLLHMGVWTHRRKDGSRIDVEITVQDVRFGESTGRLVLVTDVTLRRQTEAALQKSELRYRLAAANGDVWDWDVTTGQVNFSTTFWQRLGVATAPPPEAAVARFEALMHPDDVLRWHRAIREHIVRHMPYDFEYRAHGNGSDWRWYHTRGQAVWDENGRATYMAGTTFDITDRRRAQEALNEAEAYRRRLFEQLGDGVLLVDRDCRLLDTNAQALKMLGYTRAELLRMRLQDVLADFEHARIGEQVPGVLAGAAHIAEWEHVRKDGGHFPAEVSARALDDRRYIAVIRDITERRAAEKALLGYQFELSDLAHRLLTQEKVTTQRIAQVLHDNLGQTLAVARLTLDAAVTRAGTAMPASLSGECGRLGASLDLAVRQVREVLADLRPPLLEENGLAAALDNEIRANPGPAGGADVLLETADGTPGQRWPADVEYAAFMVVREAITNARQHAGGSLIRIVLDGDDEGLTVEVIDDGSGIPSPLVDGRPGHLGIVGMRERAVGIGARFAVASEPEGGTRVSLRWQGPRP